MTGSGTQRDKIGAGSHHVSVVTTTVAFALSRGFSMAEIEAATGLDGAVLGDPEARPPAEATHRLWKALVAAQPDRPVGVEVARAASLGALGGLMHGMQFADTLREAINFLIRHRAILCSHLDMELVETGDEAQLVAHHPADEIDGGSLGEAGAGIVVRVLREVLNPRATPIRVELISQPLGPLAAYRDFFRCDLRFGAERTVLVYRRDVLSKPVRQADPDLYAFASRHFELMLARLSGSSEPTDLVRLREAIATCAAAGDYRADSVARRLGLGLRTAQRKAAAHGRSLQHLIDEARRENAETFLADSSMTVAQVAALVGFSDERAFRRAFKRWTGVPPTGYRRGRSAPA